MTPPLPARRRSTTEERSCRPGGPVRHVDLLVLSDVHLGAEGSRAEHLLDYLAAIRPQAVVLNGDIVDAWEFDRRYWPHAHAQVVRRLLQLAASGVSVHYVTGNHDAVLRGYGPLTFASVHVVDELELELDGRRVWFVHGDRIEESMRLPRWRTAIGTWFYDGFVGIDNLVNRARRSLGMPRVSIASRLKWLFPCAGEHVERFEAACAQAAIERGVDAVVTGHIHHPSMAEFEHDGKRALYLNSGDWVESLSALEFHDGEWRVARWAPATEATGEVGEFSPQPA
jgi:UDP-2,3-diacylglucosamine pyrophosphatase LpxH